jgi:hypothetical protein
MKYRNKKSGVVIDVTSVISGEDWEEIKTPSKTAPKSTAKKKEE